MAEGTKLVGELAAAGMAIDRIYAVEGAATPPCRDTRIIAPAEMKRISGLQAPPPVLALVVIPRYEFLPDYKNLVLCLDDIQDPGNLGTIIRLADWFGIKDIICSPGTADCFSPKVVQATMGAIARVRMYYADPVVFLTETGANVPVYGTFLDGENIYDASLDTKGVIVLGNEGKGISRRVALAVTRKLYIPSYPGGDSTVESLNVASAAAIVCSEFRRRGKS